jgi:hypothetical protein
MEHTVQRPREQKHLAQPVTSDQAVLIIMTKTLVVSVAVEARTPLIELIRVSYVLKVTLARPMPRHLLLIHQLREVKSVLRVSIAPRAHSQRLPVLLVTTMIKREWVVYRTASHAQTTPSISSLEALSAIYAQERL